MNWIVCQNHAFRIQCLAYERQEQTKRGFSFPPAGMFKCKSCWGQIHQHLNGYVGDIYIYSINMYIPWISPTFGRTCWGHIPCMDGMEDSSLFFCAQKGCLPLSFAFRGLPTIWDTPTTEGGFLRKILPFLMTTWWISASNFEHALHHGLFMSVSRMVSLVRQPTDVDLPIRPHSIVLLTAVMGPNWGTLRSS
jgi:hypothetical protein